MKIKAVVIGDSGVNSLGIIRSLGEKKITVDAIVTIDKSKNKKDDIRASKYINNYVAVDKAPELAIQSLLKFGEGYDKIFVFPTSDFVLGVLSDNMSILDNRFYFPDISGEIGLLKDLMSKSIMAELAERAGFDIPIMVTYTVNSNFQSDTSLFEKFNKNYPLIVKSDSINLPGCDFKIVKDKNELVDFLKEIVGRTVIIQEFIENAEEIAIQGIGYGHTKAPDFFGIIHKIRLSVFSLGTTSYAELRKFDNDRLQTICSKFIEIIGFSGICDFDVLIKGEKFYFIECNYRNGSNGYSYTKMGANLPLLWLSYSNGDKDAYNKEKSNELKNIYFVNDFGDVAHVFKRNINIFKWIFQYITADVRLSFNLKDLKPFFVELLNIGLTNRATKK